MLRSLSLLLPGLLLAPINQAQNCSFRELQELVPSTVSPSFGSSLDINGDRIVVGEPGSGASGVSAAGAVGIYERDPAGQWGLVQTLVASDAALGASFGTAVAVDGERILVGDPGAGTYGRVYVFDRDPGTGLWLETDQLEPDLSLTPDLRTFGERLALSGDRAAIAFRRNLAGSAFPDTAVVSMYELSVGQWDRIQNLVSPQADDEDFFASDLDLENDRLVVGARDGEDATGVQTGAVHVFERGSGGTWAFAQTLLPADGAAADWFGAGVSLSADRVLVGSPRASHSGFRTPGAAYLFELSAGAFSQVEKLIASNPAGPDWFGKDVALCGDRALIGGPYAGQGSRGVTYLFSKDEGGPSAWGEVSFAPASRPTPFGFFGCTLALGQRYAVIGIEPALNVPAGAFVFDAPEPGLPATAVLRNAGANPSSLVTTVLQPGQSFFANCDLSTTGHTAAWLFAFEQRSTVVLPGGQVLLALDAGSGELLSGSGLGPDLGPTATFQLLVPDDLSLCGAELTIQALHAFGVVPFALSNAVDLTVGDGRVPVPDW